MVAPTAPGTYNYRWQMVQDDEGWFGGMTDAPLTITVVAATAPPTATITAPVANAVVSGARGGSVPVTVSGSGSAASGASITSLDVLLNGAVVHSVNAATVSQTLWLSSGNTHAIQIRANDNKGKSTLSAARNVNVLIDDASYISSQAVPATMTPGATATVSVTMQNTGTSTWTAGRSFFLGAQKPQDNTIWRSSNRVQLPAAVAPGGQQTFTFDIKAPASNGNYGFQWRMVQEFVGWFGAMSPDISIAVAAQAPTVALTRPASGSTYTVSGATAEVPVSGSATAAGSATISKIELLDNGALVPGGLSNGSSIGTSVALAPGRHSLQLRATDSLNMTSLSSAASVTVLNTAPSVSISAPDFNGSYPAAGSSGTVRLAATATAYNGASVQKIDVMEGSTLRASGSGASLNTTVTLAPGSHTLTFIATDSTQTTGSSFVIFTVAGAAAPTIAWTTPAADAVIYTAGSSASTNVTATASAANGATVKSLELLDGGAVIAATNSDSLAQNVALNGLGVHKLQLRATDSLGQVTTSAVRNVTVAAAAAGNSAAFVIQSVPTTMRAGQPYTVTVTMRNTGTSTWTPEGKYRLGAQNPQDTHEWVHSGRAYLNGSVASGELAVFTIPVTAPRQARAYNFQWKMLQENVEWFGAQSSNVSVQVNAGAGPGATLEARSNNIRVTGTQTATVTLNAAGTSSNSTVTKLELFQASENSAFSATASQTFTGSAATLSWSPTVNLPAGVYAFKVRVTDAANVATESPVAMVNITNSTILGLVTGVTARNDKYFMTGWACQSGVTAPLNYQLYLDAPTFDAGAVLLENGVANVGTEPNNAGVQAQCSTPGVPHSFAIDLSPYVAQYAGRQLYVRASNAAGTSSITLPCTDYSCAVPGTLRVGLTTPKAKDVFYLPNPAFLRMVVSGATGPILGAGFVVNGSWVDAKAEADSPGAYSASITLPASSTPHTVYARARQGNSAVLSERIDFTVSGATVGGGA
ncbi:MAG: NBR1-Ig-like domain-containing protein, partial [Duganella sp.]